MQSKALESLFDDIEQRPLPTESRLTWVNEVDTLGVPLGYLLAGDIIDNDGKPVGVAEYSPSFDRAWNTLLFYTHNFRNVSVFFETKTI